MTWRFGGADVAHYQDEAGALINWDALKAGSLDDYAATKVTQRHNYVDPTSTRHRVEMKRCKFKRRVLYHWQSPTVEASIKMQVAHVKRSFGTLEVGEAFMSDSEQNGITEPETFDLVTRVEQEITGRPSILYFGVFTAGQTLVRSQRLRESEFGPRPIHIAAYISEASLALILKQQGLTGLRIDLNQFGSSGLIPGNGHVPGVTGRCDMNQVNNFAVLDLACGYSAQPQPQPVMEDSDMDVVTNAMDFKDDNGVVTGPAGTVKFAVAYRGQSLYHLSGPEWVAGGSKPGWPMSDDDLNGLAAIPMPPTGGAEIDLDALATKVAAKIVIPTLSDFEVTSTVTSTVTVE